MHSQSIAREKSELILIVDDDVAVCKSLKFSLEVEGFLVRTFGRGEDLLQDSARARCSCFVVDQKLPDINGIDLIGRLRDQKINAPAILITSHPSASLKTRAAGAGVPIVEKPLLGNALIDRIHAAIMPRQN